MYAIYYMRYSTFVHVHHVAVKNNKSVQVLVHLMLGYFEIHTMHVHTFCTCIEVHSFWICIEVHYFRPCIM